MENLMFFLESERKIMKQWEKILFFCHKRDEQMKVISRTGDRKHLDEGTLEKHGSDKEQSYGEFSAGFNKVPQKFWNHQGCLLGSPSPWIRSHSFAS